MHVKTGNELHLLIILLLIKITSANVPVVGSHNRQVSLHVGDHLLLECPIWGSNEGPVHSEGESQPTSFLDGSLMNNVIYQWNIQGLPEYAVAMDTRFRFLEGGRVVELTQPVTKSDAGIYQCSGVTGFGQKKVDFEVHVADTNDNLICVKAYPGATDRNQVLCLMNPNLRPDTIMTTEAELGSAIDLSCEAIGREPIKYLWFMGNAVADWISSSQGVRGPILHIERVGREHIGQYVCQVKNPIGTLNYTYRLTVKEPPSAIPRIIGEVENQTLIAGSSGVLTCRVKCSCSEPIIQWLKHVDPEDIDAYKAAGRSLVPLPAPRPAEAEEFYLALEKWEDAPAYMERTVVQLHRTTSITATAAAAGEITVPEREFLSSRHEGEAEERLFVSRLRLRGPVSVPLHAGKYVVMTMSRSNLKAIDYAVAYVHIVPKSFNVTVHNIMVYCVVPIALILLIAFVSLYCFLSRRNKDLEHPATRRGNVIFPPVVRGHSMSGVKKEYRPIVRQTPQSSVFSNGNTVSNGSKTSSRLPSYVAHSSPSQWNAATATASITSPSPHSNSFHNFQSHVSQPPTQLSPSPSTFYNYSGLQSLSNQPTYWHPPAPSVATETSFDQYSAIMGNPPSASGGLSVSHSASSSQRPQLSFPNV
ncbi:Immunoglobulin subtype [Echinococcus multilocularis]|uniref:Immunoglobulin subtype n=1 Tax=Echinococcus multilocularis TaxID=6211 RepID=A0A068Y5R8_ECHMU|nr:Immunoglobulin subtype [Echinococcus multilocularis]